MAFVGSLEPLNNPLHLLLLISRKKTIHLCPNLFHYGQWLHNNATDCEFSCKLCYWKSFVEKGLSKSVNENSLIDIGAI